MRLRRALVLERLDGSSWHRVEDVGAVWLRDSCAPHGDAVFWANGADECVDFHTPFRAPAWLGTIGDAQCVCEKCVPAPAGTYRWVAHECAGAEVPGEPFELRR